VLVAKLGASYYWSFIGSALFFTFLSSFLSLLFAEREEGRALAPSELGLLALYPFAQPGGFYLLTPFPYAFVAALGWAYLLFLYGREGKARLAALVGLPVWISLSYPSALVMGAFPFWRAWKEKKYLLYSAAFLGGTLLLGIVFQRQFGDFWLYFRHQAQYGRSGTFPLLPIYHSIRSGSWIEVWAFAWYAAGIAAFWQRSRPEFLFFLLAAYLFSPLSGTSESVYRHYLLLFPLGLLVALSSRPLLAKAGYLATGFALQFAYYLPLYLKGSLI